ncbi:MAG: hypothetical protein WBR18_00745 [Anaerolineales bacterium]
MLSWGPWAAAGTFFSAAMLVLPARRDLWLLGLLLQYALVSILTAPALGLQVAVVMLVGGALTVVILWLSVRQRPLEREPGRAALMDRTGFRIVSLLLVTTLGWGMGRAEWIQVAGLLQSARVGATMLLVVGLMQVGLFNRTLRVGLGVLTMISGFQVIYSVIEPSLAVIALLVMVHLGLSMTIGFLVQQADTLSIGSQERS